MSEANKERSRRFTELFGTDDETLADQVLMMAYGLTRQEQIVTRMVCRGLSTRELAESLHITPHTIQDHLKAIFDKTGVRSRRELVATILQEQYLPRAMAGQPLGH